MKHSLLVAILTLLGAAACVNASDEGAAVNADVTASGEDTGSVNGSIRVAAGKPHGDVATVNGAIRVEDDASAAAAHTVNGDIRVGARAQVQSLHTVNGNINLQHNTRVEGGIWVRRKDSSGWFDWEGNGPRIVIGPGASVQGELRFERKVQLYISDGASIGPVAGATAIRFAGETPPD